MYLRYMFCVIYWFIRIGSTETNNEPETLPAETWTLLHGDPEDIRELAALLGVKYKEQANGQFAHSNVITVLNQKGEIVHQLVGLGQDIKGTIRAINRLTTDGTAQVGLTKG